VEPITTLEAIQLGHLRSIVLLHVEPITTLEAIQLGHLRSFLYS